MVKSIVSIKDGLDFKLPLKKASPSLSRPSADLESNPTLVLQRVCYFCPQVPTFIDLRVCAPRRKRGRERTELIHFSEEKLTVLEMALWNSVSQQSDRKKKRNETSFAMQVCTSSSGPG